MIARFLSGLLAIVVYFKARACERSTYMFITSSMIPLAVVPPPLSYFGTAILVIAALCPNPSKPGCEQ